MNRPLIWAHRGASGHAPENTLPAFRLAAEMGADGVELDVQLSKDGEIVVCHDETVDRTSSAKGCVRDYTLDELKRMDFSCGNLAWEGVRIPTLEEVLDLLEGTGLTVNIELKTGVFFYPGLEEKVVELVRRKGWQDRILYSSFNHRSLQLIRGIDPQARTGLLYADGLVRVVPYAREVGVSALHPALYNLQYPDVVREARENGLDINVWTVNSEAEILLCRGMGVHAIITNYPDKVRRILEQK